MRIRQVANPLAAAAAVALLGACAYIPLPKPPTPPTPAPPTPVCQPEAGQFANCWHRPPEAPGWTYRCAAPWLPEGFVDVVDPVDCPKAPTGDPTPPPPPPPPPSTSSCPGDPMPMGARVMFAKVVRADVHTGLPGKMDSTPRVNDQGYCDRVTNETDPVYNCKANPEGSGYVGCEDEFLGQRCPRWEWSTDLVEPRTWHLCKPVGSPVSCDHFDDWNEQGPYKGRCETNAQGSPITGFAMVAHGPDGWKKDGTGTHAWIRACSKDGVCSAPQEIAH